MKLTVIGRDNSNARHDYESVLIYYVEVENTDHDTVRKAFVECRKDDVDLDDEDDIEILFAFDGDLTAIADWRD